MKRISYVIGMALMISSSFFTTTGLTSCGEDDSVNIDNNGGYDYEDEVAGTIQDFNVTLNYISNKPSSLGAFDAETCQAVSYTSSAADVALGWQQQQGYFITQPNSSLLKECFAANNIAYSNSSQCTIQNLGKININEYKDINELSKLQVSSGKIANLPGNNQIQVESGDVIAFKTSNGTKGVAKLSGLSKVSKGITLTGVVYYSSSTAR